MIKSLLSVGILIGIATSSAAGTPFDQPITCPVGGEEFTFSSTMSCSTMGRTMSFSPITSCDWVEKLPVCPSNNLPIYREFTPEEVTKLEDFLRTDTYNALSKLNKWQAAYDIEAHLQGTGSTTAFWLQVNFLWDEPADFFGDKLALQRFQTELPGEVARESDENKPFIYAISAYVSMQSGNAELAAEHLEQAKTLGGENEYLMQYVDRIDGCMATPTADDCAPNAGVNN